MKQSYLGIGKQIYLCEYNYNKNSPSLLILPNVGWYHVGPNRMFSQIAAQCLQKKFNCFCFDYIGSGESYGDFVDSSYQNMMDSFKTVYEYITKNYNDAIYVMGYGAGNILLKEIETEQKLYGAIYYLPRFDNLLRFHKEILDDITAKETGYFQIWLTNEKENFMFWRGILGEIHDCTYNPVKYSLVNELCEKLLKYKEADSNAKNRLILSDKDVDNQKADTVVIKEFSENILPKDWYRTVNLWPDTLYRSYCEIVEWMIRKSTSVDLLHTQEVDKTYKSTEMSINNSIRQLVTFQSGDNQLCGVIHRPKRTTGKVPCVIFIPGLGGDKVDNFNCGTRLGDLLSENELACFRYDNRFSGCTPNELTNFNWTDVIDDFHNAVEFLSDPSLMIDVDKIMLVSWSNGAKLLGYIISRNRYRISKCCLWNPVFIDADIGDKYKDKANMGKNMTRYKKNSRKQLVTQIGGEYLGMSFNIDNKKYDFIEYMKAISVPCKVVWGSKDVDSKEYVFLNLKKQDYISEEFMIESKHHLFSYSSISLVITETMKFLKKN